MRSFNDLSHQASLAWNCGLACPSCNSRDDFMIQTNIEIRVSAATGWSQPEELQIEHDNPVACSNCGFQAYAERFNENIAPVVMDIGPDQMIEIDVVAAGSTDATRAVITTTRETSLLIAKALDTVERSAVAQGVCIQAAGAFEIDWLRDTGDAACSSETSWVVVSPSGLRLSTFDTATGSMLLSEELPLDELLFLSPCESLQADAAC